MMYIYIYVYIHEVYSYKYYTIIKIKNLKINQTYIYDNKDTLSKNEI